MVSYRDIKTDTYTIGLVKLTGLKIKEIHGYFSSDFGEEDPYFQVSTIEMEDGSLINVEGEHDCPYLDTFKKYPIPNMDNETLTRLYQEQNEQEDS